MKYFVVSVHSTATKQQGDAITAHFQNSSRFGFWHWFQNFWIVQSVNPNMTAAELRTELQQIAPTLHLMVLAVIPIQNDWSGFGDPKMAEWLNKYWKQM